MAKKKSYFGTKYNPKGTYLAVPTPSEALDMAKPWIPVVIAGFVVVAAAIVFWPQLRQYLPQQPAASVVVAAPQAVSIGQVHTKVY